MKIHFLFLTAAALSSFVSGKDFRPPSHMENIPAANESVQQCYVFETTPGIRYTVQSSDDLGNWTSQNEIYGLGHEYVVTMREFTEPPPPPPGTPPATPAPSTVNASLRMNPAAGVAGGTVVSWASLDDEGPVVCHIPANMDVAWNLIPLYAQTFTGYSFFIWHPGAPLAPPASNPALSPNDSALLAAIEANLPAMNLEVTTSVAVYEIGPLPRYALFPITNAMPSEGWKEPFQINNLGTVLYENGIWTAGVWKPLVLQSGDLENCSARAINDHNVILGGGRIELATDQGTLIKNLPLKGQLEVAGLPGSSSWYVRNLALVPGGVAVAMSYNPDAPTVVWQHAGWHEESLYAKATDMAADGAAIGVWHGSKTARILLNGKWEGIIRTVPDGPAQWRDETTKLLDTTPGGWILAQSGTATKEHAVMLPIKVDGVDPDYVPLQGQPGDPVPEPPEYLAGGVDHTSMAAESGTGRVPEIWIMAPAGESKSVRFQSPLNTVSNLKVPSNWNIEFTPEVINSKDQLLQVKALASSGSFQPALKLGGTLAALNMPIKIKAMKRRTIKVAIHPVALKRAGEVAQYPSRIPSNSVEDRNDFKQELTEYLDKVYGQQVNLFFDINVMPAVEVDFDTVAPIGITAVTSGQDFTPEMSIACTNPQWPLKLANIDIWILGGTSLVEGDQNYAGMKIGGVIEGDLNRQVPYIIIDGSGSVGRIIAHEMGHIFMNGGHPDVKQNGHFTRLEGVSDVPRLMKSVGGSHTECQLVKKEWDKIEVWLKTEELNGGINQ